jgi:glycerophosphoryl diester phosphodiesterase
MAGTSLLCSVIATGIVMPVISLLLRWLVARSGAPAVADADIASFFLLSWPGFVALVVSSALLIAAAALEQACLLAIALAWERGIVLRVRDAMAFGARRAFAILRLTTVLVVRLLVLVLPFAAVAAAVYWLLLRQYDINFYLTRHPPAFWAAALLMGMDALALLVVAVRQLASWLLSLPLVAFERHWPATSFAASARRMQGHRAAAAALLAVWALVALALPLLAMPALRALGRAGAPAFGSTLPGVLAFVGLAALTWLVVGFAIGVLVKGMFALVTARFYTATLPAGQAPLPEWRGPASAGAGTSGHRYWRAVLAAIIVAAGAGAALAYFLVQDLTRAPRVLVFAHRGASAAAPENTLAAFRRAGEDHTDFVELDVQDSADGVVLVAHDSDLMKVARSPLKIWASTAAELRTVDIGSFFSPAFADQRVPTLAEALAACKGVSHVDIELKDYGHDQQLEERVVALVEAAGMQDQIVTMSLSNRMVARMKLLRPGWTSGLLTARAIGRASRLPVDFLAVESKTATIRFIRSAHAAGKPVYVWTVNDPQAMIRYIGQGVDGLITNHPDLARQVIAHYQALSPAGRLFLLTMMRLGGREETSEPDDATRP